MAHNVKIRYYARENVKMKPHSFFAQPIPNGTYGFEELCKEASHKTGLEAHDVRAAVEMYMDAVMSKLLDGFRVEVGSNFITLGPGLTAKVKDELNDDGTVKKACTAEDLTAVGAKSRVTASVHPDFTYHFSQSVKWQKTDKQGNIIETDEDDATLDDDDELNQGGSQNQGGTNTGGSGSDTGNGDDNGGGGGNGGADLDKD